MSRLRPNEPVPIGVAQADSMTGRTRVNLTPGHSLMDWIRLGREKGDLSGVGTRKKDVTLDELGTHNTEKDLWMAIKGKVYNITPYIDFHPGGLTELMRAAGGDGTQLFDEIHSWVNVESMLSKCLVGPLVESEPGVGRVKSKPRLSFSKPATMSYQPPVPLPPPDQPCPAYDWYQTPGELKVVLYTRMAGFLDNRVVVDISGHEVVIEAYVKEYTYFIHFKPSEKLEDTCKVVTVKEKVEISFKKKNDKMWQSIGTPLKLNKVFIKTKCAEPRFWHWTVMSNTPVTHDTRLIALKCPVGTNMVVPIGYHFIIHHMVQGMELARNYTVALPSLIKDNHSPKKSGESSSMVPDKDRLVYLMIKSYYGGALSPWLTSIKPGEKVKMNRFDGNFDLNSLNNRTHLVMFAAGTGFTAMIRIIYYALYDMPNSSMKIKLVFYNKTPQDILWQADLDHLAKTMERFTVIYVLSRAQDTWKGLTGRVNSEHIKMFVPKPSSEYKPLLLICGQYQYNDSVESYAIDHGLAPEDIHSFKSIS